jgi:transposase
MSKNRVIVEAVLAGQSHGSVARQYGISTVWVGKLVARWRAGGWDAVATQSTRPKSNPNATSQQVVARVIALRQELNRRRAGRRTAHPARPPAQQRAAGTVSDDDLADPDP